MTAQRTTVVFDLGGVLIDWNPEYLYRKFFGDDAAGMRRFLDEICTPLWNAEQDGGRSLAEATDLLVRQHPQERDLIEAFYGRWEEMLGGPIAGTVRILAELREANVPLYSLTNWSAETFPIAQRLYDFLGWFRGIAVSGKLNMKKPDRRIYEYLASTYGIDPHAAVYIDDVPKNVAPAVALGFHGILFQSPDQLRAELRGLGFPL